MTMTADETTGHLRIAASRALVGLTILLVEDSAQASEAMRLLCQRSGARLRRADCLRSARRHLQGYRPSAVIVDLGLPDGPGEELIAELSRAQPRIPVVLGLSGDAAGEARAMAAGADGFVLKPLESLLTFQRRILGHVGGPGPVPFVDDAAIAIGRAGAPAPDLAAVRPAGETQAWYASL